MRGASTRRPPPAWTCLALRVAFACAVPALLATMRVAAVSAEAPATAASFRVRSVTGETLDLDALRAKGPVLIDFWATWCKPCLASITGIEEIRKTYGPLGLTVIGVSEDGPRNFAKVRPFAARLGMRYPIVLDQDESLGQKFQVRALPTTVLIDRDGRIVRYRQGYRPGESEALREAVRALLEPGEDREGGSRDSVDARR